MLNFMFEMKRDQFTELAKKTDLAFVPVSPMEAHGPHLPISADVLTATQMCIDCARKLQANGMESLIAAPINYCLADVASCFAGTITLRYETLVAIIQDVCTGLYKNGFKKVVLISGHAEPASMDAIKEGAQKVKDQYEDFNFIFSGWFDNALPLTYENICRGEHPEWDIHAGEIETSQIMYLRPEWVDMDALKDLPVNNEAEFFGERFMSGIDNFKDLGAPNTYFGDPAVATAETGRKIFDVVSDYILGEIDRYLLKTAVTNWGN